ncbi:MAG: PD-(D/E)XK nuclease family protein [Flavobacteriales bacterium]|nr:PD-(D/E)XK nuclease family protein [Flavobacteriales bacterium]
MEFISKTIQDICKNTTDFTNKTFIIPGKRPALFIKKELRKHLPQSAFLPRIITIQEFTEEVSNCITVQGIQLWLLANEIYKNQNPQQTLSDFLKWIPTVLDDLNDLEIFTENPEKVIDYLISIERIQNWGITIGELENYESANKTIEFWKKIKPFYAEFKEYLNKNNLATSGISTKKALEKILSNEFNNNQFYYFIGFNAFSPKEEQIIKHLVKNNLAQTYFDADTYYINKNQEAGKFIEKYQKWNTKYPFSFVDSNFEKPKIIKEYPAGNTIIQAKIASHILNQIPKEEFANTAVILCDEKMLLPTIQSISEDIEDINLTMGFPVNSTFYSSFFNKILRLKSKAEKQKSKNKYYIKEIQEILNNPVIPTKYRASIDELYTIAQDNNWFFLSADFLINHFADSELYFIFRNYENPKEIFTEFTTFIENIIPELEEKQHIASAVLKGMHTLLTTFNRTIVDNKNITDFESILFIYKQIEQQQKLDFIGEPLTGIQIMGLLESRLLSFKNIILISVNEGTIPLGRTENSFIPFDVKKEYDIHTFLEKDSIYAYHFYRILQRAENIHLIYDNSEESEQSRFLLQLKLESNHKIETVHFSYPHKTNPKEIKEIQKNDFINSQLKNWFEKRISASALTSYLYNPIDFYLKYILELKDEKELDFEISSQENGTLIHNSLENLYKNYLNIELTEIHFSEMKSRINDVISNQIKELKLQEVDSGINYLHLEIAKKTIQKIIQYDESLVKNGNSLKIIDLEREFSVPYQINDNQNITFYGFIDRIDELNGAIRVIDYKSTSKTSYKFNSTATKPISEIELSYNHNHLIQLAIYSYYILSLNKYSSVQSGVFGFNSVSKGVQLLEIEKEQKITLKNLQPILEKINDLILEIINPEIPFTEKVYSSWN